MTGKWRLLRKEAVIVGLGKSQTFLLFNPQVKRSIKHLSWSILGPLVLLLTDWKGRSSDRTLFGVRHRNKTEGLSGHQTAITDSGRGLWWWEFLAQPHFLAKGLAQIRFTYLMMTWLTDRQTDWQTGVAQQGALQTVHRSSTRFQWTLKKQFVSSGRSSCSLHSQIKRCISVSYLCVHFKDTVGPDCVSLA